MVRILDAMTSWHTTIGRAAVARRCKAEQFVRHELFTIRAPKQLQVLRDQTPQLVQSRSKSVGKMNPLGDALEKANAKVRLSLILR